MKRGTSARLASVLSLITRDIHRHEAMLVRAETDASPVIPVLGP